jgi:hypothetical protein
MKNSSFHSERRVWLCFLILFGACGLAIAPFAVQKAPEEKAAFPEKRYQEWSRLQKDPRAAEEDKVKSTVTTYFRLVLDSWLAGELRDFGFLFDRRSAEAISDCAFEQSFFGDWLREWKDNGVRLSKDEAEVRILSCWNDGDRAKVRAVPFARFPYIYAGGKDEPRSLGEQEFRLNRQGRQWLIAGIKGRSDDLNSYLWETEQKGMEARGTSVVETESRILSVQEDASKRGFPGAPERWQAIMRALDKPHTISLEDIKARLIPYLVGRITYFDKRYAIAEVIRPMTDNWFYFFDLATGEMQLLPTAMSYARLEGIESSDRIIFRADGRNTLGPEKDFPLTIKCTKGGEGKPFAAVHEPRYLPIGQRTEFGLKSQVMIVDVKVAISGIEVSFGSVEGKEEYFYAAHGDIPVTRTECDAEKNQFIVTFMDTALPENPSWAPSVENSFNDYLSSVKWTRSGDDTRLIISLKSNVSYYRGFDLWAGSDVPFMRLTFHREQPAWYEW